ncbi:uncharacterized protein LOC107044173 [Diachasma alloeum]|uniref:uncharacterized protein LOC107044173 n=1 Tax=Diachasma alloeum TaxID=454923 RepID=UPI0007384B89|nr:uncharacterized protein LOC107044173 [Diachasma alloeum]
MDKNKMKPLWNYLHLDRPPTSIWRPKPGDFELLPFISTINRALEDISCQGQLNTEAAILSRLIYRMKSKFRADKGLKSMEKVNSALLNYLKLSIERDYEYLKSNTAFNEKSAILPSRQMVEYVLVRTQGFAKLMCRIESVARTAAHFLKNRINLGQAWTVSVIAYSVISRIWLLSRYLLRRCCNWYNDLYSFAKHLRPIGVEWMSREQTLPSDLKTWIAVPWIDEHIQCPTESQVSKSIFSLITASEDKEFVHTRRQEMEQTVEHDEIQMAMDNSYAASDVDERIPRESLSGSTAIPTRSKRDNSPIEYIMEKQKSNQNNIPLNVMPDLGEKLARECFTSIASNTMKPHVNNNISAKSMKKLKMKKKSKDATQSKSALNIDGNGELSRESAIFQSKLPQTQKKRKFALSKIKTKEDLCQLLQQNTYPGLDKLQWNILKKSINKTVRKLEKCPATSTKYKILLNRAIRSIRDCVS